MIALRAENEQLKRRIAEQEARIADMNSKLDQLITLQQRPQPHAQETPIEETVDEESTMEESSQPQAKKRALEAHKSGGIRATVLRLEERLNRHIETTNARLPKLEQTCQAIQETLIQMQAAIARLGAGMHQPQPNQRPTWPEQR